MAATHFEIRFRCRDADEEGWMLVDAGALGVEILGPELCRAFFQGTEAKLEQYIEAVQPLGFIAESRSLIPDTNWVQRCSEVMEPLSAGALSIVPVATAGELPAGRPPEEIALIPGAGFGTGHHASTELALLLMQEPELRECCPKRVFDLGTGSGILSIAAAKLFGATVDAVDIDPAALENACENAAMNGCESSVRFSQASIEAARPEYDLLTANLYAELLCGFADDFARTVRGGGFLVLSGIMNEKAESIRSVFGRAPWRLIMEREDSGWSAFLVKRDR